MTLTLAPLGKNDLARVAHITVATHQIKFSGTVQEAFESDESGIDFHAIVQDAHPVGFFKIDRHYPAAYPFAPHGTIGLRAFMVDHAVQGRGIATAAVALMASYLPRYYQAGEVYLTVNMSNPAAVKCYRHGGFADTGGIWPEGSAGPQHIMRLHLGSDQSIKRTL